MEEALPDCGVRCGIAFAPFISSAEAAHRRGSFRTSATATESRRVSASVTEPLTR